MIPFWNIQTAWESPGSTTHIPTASLWRRVDGCRKPESPEVHRKILHHTTESL